MKKLFTVLICTTMILGIGGCSDSKKPFSDNSLPVEDVDKLLKDHNFKTEIKYLGVQLGTIVTISNDKDDEFRIQYTDGSSHVNLNREIDFYYKNDINKVISFSASDRGTVKIENCSILLDTEEIDSENDSNECTDSLVTDAKDMKKKLNDFLIKYNLNVTGLRIYCDEYVNKNLDNAKDKAEEQKKQEDEDKKKIEQEDKKKNAKQYKESKKTFVESCETYEYKNIFRNAEEYQGKHAKFTGKVVQVVNNILETDLRVNVTQDGLAFYDDTVYVVWQDYNKQVDPDAVNRFLEDDIITMYGTLDGIETYKSTTGASVTIPKFEAMYIELIK